MFVNQSDYRLEHEWFKGALRAREGREPSKALFHVERLPAFARYRYPAP